MWERVWERLAMQSKFSIKNRGLSYYNGGETGIRTLGGVTPTTVFETAPFDRSGISPRWGEAIPIPGALRKSPWR